MSEGPQEIKCINWKEVFAFAQVFKSFRMAIHLSKLLLGLAVVALIYIGGVVLDRVWSFSDDGQVPAAAATAYYVNPGRYDSEYALWQDQHVDRALALLQRALQEQAHPGTGKYSSLLRSDAFRPNSVYDAFASALANEETSAAGEPKEVIENLPSYVEANWKNGLQLAVKRLDQAADKIGTMIDGAETTALKTVDANTELTGDERDEAIEGIETDARKARFALTRYRAENAADAQAVVGAGVFETFLDHEILCLANATNALTALNITDGAGRFNQDAPRQVLANGQGGVLYWMMMACTGVKWLLSRHVVFAIILGVWSLAVWALLGGAIHRIAALQAAREEKISIRQAMRFSLGKFLSFFTAPLIPTVLILLFCGLLALSGLILNAGYVGPILVGVLFGLALILGLIIAFLVVGLVAGGGLMYPTIAVEGSDSFDAISRSFSYVFARPWRAGLYALVAAGHGAVCYVFVRVFAFVALKATHMAVKLGTWTGGGMSQGASDRMDVLWQAPQFDSFHAPLNWAAMDGWGDRTGAVLIAFWVYIVIGLVAAFALTYFASSTTVIYYLLRRKVDATDLDDVYIEEETDEMPAMDEEPTEEPPASEASETSSEEQPPAQDEGEKET